MAGKLDEISRAIGGLQESSNRLTDLFDRHCDQFDRHCADDDRRHNENKTVLATIKSELAENSEAIKGLAQTIKEMRPIIDGVQVSQWKRAGAVGLAATVLGAIGLVIEQVISAAVGWYIHHH